jgi:hypothetical protein
MKLFAKSKDGGPESKVWGYWLLEAKSWLSIVVLRFDEGTRDAFHSHAFNSVSWVLWGELTEEHHPDTNPDPWDRFEVHRPSLLPVLTFRDTTHKVKSTGTTWVLSFRGPWADKWKEITNKGVSTLTHGRKEVSY